MAKPNPPAVTDAHAPPPVLATQYPVHWVHDAVLGLLGVCSYARRVFAIGTPLHAIVVATIGISPTECEEGGRCLHFTCPLNHTTLESYREAKQIRSSRRFVRDFQALMRAGGVRSPRIIALCEDVCGEVASEESTT